jgi:two-component sensor histidine kinase
MKSIDNKLEHKDRDDILIHYPDEKTQKQNGRPTPWGKIIFCIAVYLGIIYLQAIGIFQTTVNGILAQVLVLISVYLAASCGRAGFFVGLSLNVINLIAILLAVLIDHKAEAITGLAVNIFTIVSISIIGVLTSRTQKEIDTRTQTEFRIREALGEKEVLLKEVHHRVKNNLQIISSLLNLQSNQIADQKTRDALRESQNRVRSMALIHEKLYQSSDLAKIDFSEYVKSLAADLFRSYQRGLGKVNLIVEADEVALELDRAIPCGLILNELITNALKYAFSEGRYGTLRVELRAGPDHEIKLQVADDGVGMPPGFDYRNADSLGIKLVQSLTAQLDGQLQVEQSNGTVFQISFKV